MIVQACDSKEVQDRCTVGCTLQRIFVTSNSQNIGEQPLIEALLQSDDKPASEEIIKQLEEFSNKLQVSAL